MQAIFGWLSYTLLGITILFNLLVLHELHSLFQARNMRVPSFLRTAVYFNGFMGVVMACVASIFGRF